VVPPLEPLSPSHPNYDPEQRAACIRKDEI
jgi:hypothetical protein